MDFENGAVVEGKYEIECTLGKGGMGVVYRAKNLRTGELFALKFLHPRFADRPSLAKRLRTEATAGTTIKSPHVTRMLDVGDASGVRGPRTSTCARTCGRPA